MLSCSSSVSPRRYPSVNGNNEPSLSAHPFLPVHEQQAIHAFFDHVRAIGDDEHECAICNERYNCMNIQDAVCARCDKEVIRAIAVA